MTDLRFLIVTWENSADQRHCVVAGRCYEGPIVLGNRFCQLLTRGQIVPVDLTVEEIRSYGHLLDEIDPVLTGELLLSGTLSHVEKHGESFLIGKRADT
jgi:hypothetical protein